MTQRSAHHGIRRNGLRRTLTAWAAAVTLALTGAPLAAAAPGATSVGTTPPDATTSGTTASPTQEVSDQPAVVSGEEAPGSGQTGSGQVADPYVGNPLTSAHRDILKAQQANVVEFQRLLNAHRKAHGVDPLLFNASASIEAWAWSSRMRSDNVLRHSTEVYNPLDANDPHYAFPGDFSRWGENVAYNQSGGHTSSTLIAPAMFEQWKNSPAHNEAMLNPDFDAFGIGFVWDPNQRRFWGTTTFYAHWGTHFPNTWVEASHFYSGYQALSTNTGDIPRFADVADTTFEKSINWLAASGITGGYSDGTFRPQQSVKRYEMAAFLHRYASPANDHLTGQRFSDVPTSHNFYEETSWAAAHGITNGYADGRFGLQDGITRGQIAAFMNAYVTNYCNLDQGYSAPSTSTFSDIGPGGAFYSSIAWLADSGITGGFGDGTFRPSKTTTRGEMAAFMERLNTYVGNRC